MADFERLGVCPEIIQAISEEGWLLPTSVQDEAIPLILGGGDVCVAAETGSGKTGAFGIPCLQVVYETLQNKALTTITQNTSTEHSSTADFLLNVNDKDSMVFISNGQLDAQSSVDNKWLGVKSTNGVISGAYMFEVRIIGNGLARIGCGAPRCSYQLGTDDRSFGYGGTGMKSWNRSFNTYGEPYGHDDIIACLIDREHEQIAFAKNGKDLGIAFTIPSTLKGIPLQPAVCGKPFHVTFNFNGPMAYPLPGFRPIGTADTSHHMLGITAAIETVSSNIRQPLCLILEPTRDLAEQTWNCMRQYGRYLESPLLRLGLFVGGGDEKLQRDTLRDGVDIAIGTLQKLLFYIKKGQLNISNMRFLVLDEADDLIKFDDHNEIIAVRKDLHVQTLFFSATLHSQEVRQAINRITTNPTWVDLKGRPAIPDTVHCVLYKLDPTLRSLSCSPPSFNVLPITDGVHNNIKNSSHQEILSEKVKLWKPQIAIAIADTLFMKSCVIFCRTNLDCDNFEKYLISLGGGAVESGKENPYSCVVLAGMRDQQERRQNLEYFKNGNVRFLICTDVAARGIDIKELPYLIMLSLPDDPNQFFHRVGRVGRADSMGLAISIVSTVEEKVWYHKCPNRGRGCYNTRLTEEGGCCIWYNEIECLKGIEQQIGNQIPIMDPTTFSVEGIITFENSNQPTMTTDKPGRRAQHLTNTTSDSVNPTHIMVDTIPMNHFGNMTIYGKSKDRSSDKVALQRLQEIAPRVDELKSLEKSIQQSFIQLLCEGVEI